MLRIQKIAMIARLIEDLSIAKYRFTERSLGSFWYISKYLSVSDLILSMKYPEILHLSLDRIWNISISEKLWILTVLKSVHKIYIFTVAEKV